MRARGGGVISASALVAVGTSLLLAALVGLGISELTSTPTGGASGQIRTQAAAVVVPGGDAHQRPAPSHVRHSSDAAPARTTTVAPAPVVVSSPVPRPAPVAPAAATAAPTSTNLTRAPRTSSPTPSPVATHGNGHGKAKGAGNGHHQPSKH